MSKFTFFRIACIITLVLNNFILPSILYGVLAHSIPALYALCISAIPPFLELVLVLILLKRIDITSAVVFFSILLGVMVSAFTEDPRLLMIKDSFSPFLFGCLFLASLLRFPRPNLIWHYHSQFSLFDKEESAKLIHQWESDPRVHSITCLMSWVWGSVLLFESLLHLLLLFLLPIEIMTWLSLVLIGVSLVFLILWTILYTLHIRKKQSSLEGCQVET